jgi:hypothetical protein
MKSDGVDIRNELEARIHEVQNEIGSLQADKAKIDEKLQNAEKKLGALREVYRIEAERHGDTKVPLFRREGISYRFAGMRLVDALDIIQQENPKIDKRQALKILEREGFDFRGKRPLPAVHFAWVALGQRKKRKKLNKDEE